MKNIFTSILVVLAVMWSQSIVAQPTSDITFTYLNVEQANCGQSDGEVTISISGGTQPYIVNFEGIQTQLTGDVWGDQGLAEGDYLLEVTDASGLESATSWQIASVQLSGAIICGPEDASLEVVVTSGVPPYLFEWSNGANGAIVTGLVEGYYEVAVTDAVGCFGLYGNFYIEPTNPVVLNCNQAINFSLSNAQGGLTEIFPEILIEGPFSTCSMDVEFNLVEISGTVLADYASTQIVDCSFIGELAFNLRDNISGVSCSGLINIEDKNGPTPYCISNASVTLDANQEQVIYAIDYNAGSIGGCGSAGNLRYTFTSTPPDLDPDYDPSLNSSSRILDCNDYIISDIDQLKVDIYVWNEFNDSNYCTISIDVENSSNPCEISNNFVEVTGAACDFGAFDKYSLSLNGTELDQLGCFFPMDESDILVGANEITIADTGLDINILNGITTLDLVLVTRGLISGYTDNFEMIAADFDGDQAVSTKDLVEMRRYIVGLESEAIYQQYKLIDMNAPFPSDFGPFNLGSDFSSITFNDDDLLVGPIEVHVLKAGDINNSGNLISEQVSENRDVAMIEYQDLEVNVGETYEVGFDFESGTDVQAVSFEMLVDGLNILSVQENGNDFIYNNKISSLALSYYTDHPETTFSFVVECEALATGKLSEMLSLNNDFLREAVGPDMDISDLSLSANSTTGSIELTQDLFTIYPNPVNDLLNISFDNNSSNTIKNVELLSIDGKSVGRYSITGNDLSINVARLQASGLHLLRVTQDGKTMVKKVLIY